jgi:hypothetical protein
VSTRWLRRLALIVLAWVVIFGSTALAEIAGFASGSFFLGVISGMVFAAVFEWCADWLDRRAR